jgi:hypothetical protein
MSAEFQKLSYTPDLSLSFREKLWDGFNVVTTRGNHGELCDLETVVVIIFI